MSLDSPQAPAIDGAAFRIGIAAARFNPVLVDGLLERLIDGLWAANVNASNLSVVRVPGSHEVPWAAQALARRGRMDCVVGLGVLIAGDTNHHEMVIVVNSLAQARARCVGRINRGAEFAAATLEMAALRRKFSR
jgi:6,7-dimethyl-8-ribityllumazine synthase